MEEDPVRRWDVGSITVSRVQELPIAAGLLDGLIAEATPAVVLGIGWMRPDFANEDGQTLWDIHAFVVDTGEHVVLVDPGCGNGKTLPLQPAWGGLDTPFLARLAEAGYGVDDVDVIMCTHLHLDHVGWCTQRDADGTWVPTFPRARLVVVRDEYDHFLETMDAPEAEAAHGIVFEGSDPSVPAQYRLVWAETLAPLVEADRLDLVDSGAEVVPGVRYVPTPGHTRGHHSVRLDSAGVSALITGDFIHHPMQIARPAWSSRNDWDTAASAASRQEFLESCAGTDLLVLGTHFTGEGAGVVVADGDGFRLVPTGPAQRPGTAREQRELHESSRAEGSVR
jgi:glyoxylase-like metal-dependent hydrolase (beta-lactamase superfamily II)